MLLTRMVCARSSNTFILGRGAYEMRFLRSSHRRDGMMATGIGAMMFLYLHFIVLANTALVSCGIRALRVCPCDIRWRVGLRVGHTRHLAIRSPSLPFSGNIYMPRRTIYHLGSFKDLVRSIPLVATPSAAP